MDQLKHRFYILGLSLLVLIVALAGLLGILDILPKPTSSTSSPDGEPAVSQQPGDNKPQDIPSQPPEDGNQPDATPTDIPANIPNFTVSLPDSFDLNVSSGSMPGISLKSPMPPHIPVLEVAGAESTQYLKSITSSLYNGQEWVMENMGDYIVYNGELLIPPELDPNQITIDNITVAAIADIINGKVAIPTSLYPVSVNSSVPLLYFPEDGTFLSEEGFSEEAYTFETIHYIFDRRTLANADLDLLEKYLQLPDAITPRTYELADNITGGIQTSFLMAKALEDYLKTNNASHFEFEHSPQGWEPD